MRPHPVAGRRVAEELGEGAALLGERPRRQRGVEVREAVEPRVHVELDVHAAVPGVLDELHRAARLLDPVPRHEVRDLEADSGRPRAADRLGDGVGGALVPAPRVRRVEAARGAEGMAEIPNLLLCRAGLLRVLEPGRVAPGALAERLAEQVGHRSGLIRRSRAIREPDRRQPELSVGNEADDVYSGPRRPSRSEVLAGRAPVEGNVRGCIRRSPCARARDPGSGSSRSRSSPRPRGSRPGGRRSARAGRRGGCSRSGCGGR